MPERNPRKLLHRPERERNRLPVINVRNTEDLVAIGKVVRAHGLRGQVKVIPYTDTLERFESLRAVYVEFPDSSIVQHDVEKVKLQGGFVFLKLSGIDDRSAAEPLQGTWISVRREDTPALPEDSFYIYDLLGLEVFDEGGARVGAVTRVEEYPANAVLVVESDTEEIWVPALKEVVIAVDLDAGRLVVRLPEGLPAYPKGER